VGGPNVWKTKNENIPIGKIRGGPIGRAPFLAREGRIHVNGKTNGGEEEQAEEDRKV